MAWFVDEERPVPALVLDGLGWGIVVGFTLGFLGGAVGIVVGTVLGGGAGLVAGLVAGVVLAGCERARAPRLMSGVGAVGAVLAVLSLVPWWLWDLPPLAGLLVLGGPALLPLTADVVWRLRRWPARRPRRAGYRCVLSTRHWVLVVR